MVGSAELGLLAKEAISQHLNARDHNNPCQKICLGITSTPQTRMLGGSLAPPSILLRGGSLAPPPILLRRGSLAPLKFASDGGATAHPAPPTTVRQRAARQGALTCTTRCAGRGRPCHVASRGQQIGSIKRCRWILPLRPFTMVKATGKW